MFFLPLCANHATNLLLEDVLQLLCDGVADLGGLCRSTNVGGPDTLVDDGLDSLVDGLGQLELLHGILEHHTDGKDHGDGVDNALSGDIRSRTCVPLAHYKYYRSYLVNAYRE